MILKSYYSILDLIFRQPGIRLGEIVAQAHVSVRTATSVLHSLVALQVLREETLTGGKRVVLRRFYPNFSSEEGTLFFSFVEIQKRTDFLIKHSTLKGPLSDLVRELPDVESMLVFGSFANFSQTSESDLDLLFLVDKTPEKEHVRRVVERSFITFHHEVSLKIMTFAEFQKSSLYESILRNHVVVRGITLFLKSFS